MGDCVANDLCGRGGLCWREWVRVSYCLVLNGIVFELLGLVGWETRFYVGYFVVVVVVVVNWKVLCLVR